MKVRMKVDRIQHHNDGYYALRSDPALVGQLESLGEQWAANANAMGRGHYAVGSRQGMRRPQGRWRVGVVATDFASMKDNAENNTLIKAQP